MSTDVGDREADLFDVGVDKELESYHQRSKKLQNGTAAAGKDSQRHVSGRLTKRQKKDEKYGFGGRKRNAKAPDAFSSGDLSGFSVNRNRSRTFSGGVGRKSKSKIKTPRLGKSRRQAAAVKR